jgi:hypothetical protein
MPIGAIGAVAGGLGGLAGGVAGLVGNKSSQTTDVAPASDAENSLAQLLYGGTAGQTMSPGIDPSVYASNPAFQSLFPGLQTGQPKAAAPIGGPLGDLAAYVNAGPGQQDITQALTSQRALASQLRSYAQTGGLPTASDVQYGNSTAASLFGARRTALSQLFTDQGQQNNQLEARLGRGGADPILQAKLQIGQGRMFDSLQAEQQAQATQLAMALPGQRLGYAQQAASMDQQLAAQAATNRASLLGLGSQLMQQQQNFRLGAAGKTVTSGGGLGNALGGLFGGVGAGLKLGGGINALVSASGNSGASNSNTGDYSTLWPDSRNSVNGDYSTL